MKLTRLAFISTLFVSCTSFGEGEADAARLLGTWSAKRGGDTIAMTFGAKSVQMKVGDEGGSGTYAVDWTKKPVALDIDWGSHGKVTTIIELKGDVLKMENVEPGTARPKAFSTTAANFKRAQAKK